MTDRAAIEIESLSFNVNDTSILRKVSACILSGETWSILGANGAGKSTLLKCLIRVHRGWVGSVRLFGRPLESYSQRQIAQRMAYVPQASTQPFFPYTVREFVRMGRYAYSGLWGTPHPGDGEAVDRAMECTGVQHFADRTLDTLSGGERQKVLIAAALAQEADVLLLDEPTAFLDYRHQNEVHDILASINKDLGRAVITVTHDVNAAIYAGTKVLALRQGEVVYNGPSAGLYDENRLSLIFGATFRFVDDRLTGLRFVAPQGSTR